MNKIDFFGGSHGNYLELLINVFIFQQPYDLSKSSFTGNGACHVKNTDHEYLINRKIQAKHYTMYKVPFSDNDCVIRILPEESDLLILIVNSHLRAGPGIFDLDNFEKNTIFKLSQALPRTAKFMKQIINDFGYRIDYPRNNLRNYFYAKFAESCYGIDEFQNFDPSVKNYYNFSFDAFFDFEKLCLELEKIALFLNSNFSRTPELEKLHYDFLLANQGYHSQIKCNSLLENILNKVPTPMTLNIVEEAWINCQLINMFKCYDLPILIQDKYPTNTIEISNEIFKSS